MKVTFVEWTLKISEMQWMFNPGWKPDSQAMLWVPVGNVAVRQQKDTGLYNRNRVYVLGVPLDSYPSVYPFS